MMTHAEDQADWAEWALALQTEERHGIRLVIEDGDPQPLEQ